MFDQPIYSADTLLYLIHLYLSRNAAISVIAMIFFNQIAIPIHIVNQFFNWIAKLVHRAN